MFLDCYRRQIPRVAYKKIWKVLEARAGDDGLC